MYKVKIYNVGAIPGSKLFSININDSSRLEDEIVFDVKEPSNGVAELQSTLAKQGISIIDCSITPRNWKAVW